MEKQVKTNAIRMLEKAGIAFRVVTYEVDEEHRTLRSVDCERSSGRIRYREGEAIWIVKRSAD